MYFFGSTCPYPMIKSVIRKIKTKPCRARAAHIQKILGIRLLRGSEKIQILHTDLMIPTNGTCENAGCNISLCYLLWEVSLSAERDNSE